MSSRHLQACTQPARTGTDAGAQTCKLICCVATLGKTNLKNERITSLDSNRFPFPSACVLMACQQPSHRRVGALFPVTCHCDSRSPLCPDCGLDEWKVSNRHVSGESEVHLWPQVMLTAPSGVLFPWYSEVSADPQRRLTLLQSLEHQECAGLMQHIENNLPGSECALHVQTALQSVCWRCSHV